MKFFTEDPLDLDEVIINVASGKFGAVVTFSGCVRDTENGAPITAIIYETYSQMGEQEFTKIVSEIESTHQVEIALRHRVGRVPVSEASLIVACAGAHRKEAFNACEKVIDDIKLRVPIWKVEFEEAGG